MSITHSQFRTGIALVTASLALIASMITGTAHAVTIGNPDDGAGTRIVDIDNAWKANMNIYGMPERAKIGDKFTLNVEITENHDVDLDNYHNNLNGDDDNTPEPKTFSGGMFTLAISSGIAVTDITWECHNPAEIPDEEQPCKNDNPKETLQHGTPVVIAGKKYQTILVSSYVLREHTGWYLTINGNFTANGEQEVVMTGVDASFFRGTGTQGIGEQLTKNTLLLQTIVSPNGAADAPVVQKDTYHIDTKVTQDVKDITSGQSRTYTITYNNLGEKDAQKLHLSGVYLILPESEGTTQAHVTCSETSTAPCPAWANIHNEINNDIHDHEDGHNHHHHDNGEENHDHNRSSRDVSTISLGLSKYGNVYDGFADIPAGKSLVLNVTVTSGVLAPAHDTRVRTASFDAFVRERPDYGLSEDSVRADGVRGTITTAVESAEDDHPEHGDDDHANHSDNNEVAHSESHTHAENNHGNEEAHHTHVEGNQSGEAEQDNHVNDGNGEIDNSIDLTEFTNNHSHSDRHAHIHANTIPDNELTHYSASENQNHEQHDDAHIDKVDASAHKRTHTDATSSTKVATQSQGNQAEVEHNHLAQTGSDIAAIVVLSIVIALVSAGSIVVCRTIFSR